MEFCSALQVHIGLNARRANTEGWGDLACAEARVKALLGFVRETELF